MKGFWYKYRTGIVITVAFVLLVTVFSTQTVIEAIAMKGRIREMHREQLEYQRRAKEDSAFLEKLKDDKYLEKYAREAFYLKAEGEEIYLMKE